MFRNSLTGTIPSTIGSIESLEELDLGHNELAGTIPTTFSQLNRLSDLYLDSNHLSMGSATTVPTSTFSSYTLSAFGATGTLSVSENCLEFTYIDYVVTATHCPTESKKSSIFSVNTN